MNVTEAIKILKNHGWKVEKHDDKYLAVHDGKWIHDFRKEDLYTPRKLIHLTNAIHGTNKGKKIVKSLKNKSMRRKTNQRIQSDKFDDIDGETHARWGKLDPWAYD